MATLDKKSLAQLDAFVKFIKTHPEALHTKELKFFKDYLIGLKAVIPGDAPVVEEVDEPVYETPEPPKTSSSESHEHHDHSKCGGHHDGGHPEHAHAHVHDEPEPEEHEEHDPALYTPDSGFENIEMGDSSKIVTEDEDGDAYSLMGQGRKAAREGNHQSAIEKLTEAIKINPSASVFFATRAESFLELKRPNAAIRDCNRALELNPDSGKALKIRGKARRFLGKYGEAFYDLQQGNLLDYDDATDAIIKEIKERAEKAIVKQRKLDEKKRIDDLKREAADKRRKQQEEEDRRNREQEGGFPGGAGGFPGGAGGFPGGMSGLGPLLEQLAKDPEIAVLLNNPETQGKVMSFFMNGQNKDDPAVKKVLEILQRKVPGFGGAAGGAGPKGGAAPKPSTNDDLD